MDGDEGEHVGEDVGESLTPRGILCLPSFLLPPNDANLRGEGSAGEQNPTDIF